MTQHEQILLDQLNTMAEQAPSVGLCSAPFRAIYTLVTELVTERDQLRAYIESDTPMIQFNNECNCIFDQMVLSRAIDVKCETTNNYRKRIYRITLRNGYPTVVLGHGHYYVHELIGEYLFGGLRKGYVIHHIDHNKLNNTPNNLQYLSNAAHLKHHADEHKGTDFRTPEGKERCRKAHYRSEITPEIITELHNSGMTYQKIAKRFNCSATTITNRLKTGAVLSADKE